MGPDKNPGSKNKPNAVVQATVATQSGGADS